MKKNSFEAAFDKVEQKNDTPEGEIVERNGELYTLRRESKNKRTSIVMRQSVFEKVEDLAATRGQSRNDLFNEIIEEYLKTHDN